ncbi:MAG TPA: hybrid sensor histidine kinase/response regulator [Rhodoferax sp.]|jgi:signal transduction histidine kinase|nr:hybrid sensor histidine kinase/response regulator [Rhodoferax sp.]HNV60333.1 hybrid sensor histidine kinase/response regulator [Rhodoferax sp.]
MTHQTPRKPVLLVVDDQPSNIQVLHQIFKTDHEVFMATSGEQALTFCATQLPDLILLDVIMPGLNGHQVCVKLKSDPRTQDIPVIFVTGHSNPEDESEGLRLGAVDFISKPVNAATVRARVKVQLMLRQSLRQVQELNESLEDRVVLRTAELRQAMLELRQSQDNLADSEARATLSTLIASVSHELGTPLGNSRMVASTLAEQTKVMMHALKTGQIKRSSLDHYVEQVSDGVALLESNLGRSVELLGDFRQVAADQASEQRRTFKLDVVVKEILHTLSPSLKRLPHRIEVNIAPGITMDSQPGALGRVLINLVNNAYLHAFEGCTDGVLTISAKSEAQSVTLVVADNGIGMAPELLGKVFDPFFSTKIGKGGTGLGMAIVQNLVTKALGGRITMTSTVGKGTQVEMVLPLVSIA